MTDSPIKIILSYNINFKIIIHTSYFRNNLKKKYSKTIMKKIIEKLIELLRNSINY